MIKTVLLCLAVSAVTGKSPVPFARLIRNNGLGSQKIDLTSYEGHDMLAIMLRDIEQLVRDRLAAVIQQMSQNCSCSGVSFKHESQSGMPMTETLLSTWRASSGSTCHFTGCAKDGESCATSQYCCDQTIVCQAMHGKEAKCCLPEGRNCEHMQHACCKSCKKIHISGGGWAEDRDVYRCT